MTTLCSYALVPAAGCGRRLGGNKLLLPYHGTNIFTCLLRAWKDSNVSVVVAVIRKDDEPALAIAREAGVEIVRPSEDPGDMKASVQAGLRYIELEHTPQDEDVWMLAPADMPRLTAGDVNKVLTAHDPKDPAIVVPEFNHRTGHPVLFPWSMRQQVFQLNRDQGINRLVAESPSRRIALASPSCVEDIDTLQDYQRLLSSDSSAQ